MTNLFDNISEKQKEKIYNILRVNTSNYPSEINILSNVNKATFIGIIEEGKAELTFNDYNGNKTILSNLEKNSIFGSLLLNISSEEITCITKEKTKITYIEYDKILENDNLKYDYYITFIKNLLSLLRDELIEKNERIELLTKRTTRDKLLSYFKLISRKKGSRTFNLPLSFTDLADYLSVDRSAMTREIKYLKEEGFIKIDKKKVTLNVM